jgi:ketosteroid isomerase-like protein
MRNLIAALLVVVSLPKAAAQIGVVFEKDLHATVEQYLVAFSTLDVATIEHMETDDFIFVQDGIVSTKAQQMASLKAPGRKPTNLKFELSFQEGWVVSDSAVLTGTMIATGEDGKPVKGAFTHLLRRTGTEWRIQHSHYSTEAPARPSK